ncbi:hypothetical protein ACIHCQ_12845 [Streptomyces sp. NPDC052236]|uniref:hypothetical protein n=1 Tax=Streptomyces sp. NPDC052236 TaxID=3365686 RepID=UPI0037D1DED3
MIRSLPCSKPSVPARVAASLVFAITAMALSAGAAVASAAEESPSGSQPLPVRKLVNGWD